MINKSNQIDENKICYECNYLKYKSKYLKLLKTNYLKNQRGGNNEDMTNKELYNIDINENLSYNNNVNISEKIIELEEKINNLTLRLDNHYHDVPPTSKLTMND